MARRQIEIDRDKLRAAVRKLGHEYVFYMLDDAIDHLPPAKLHKIVRKYLDLRRPRPDSEKARRASLLGDVKAFETASLAGEYYESFNVNSKNFMEKSKGTTGWIAECCRLLGRCVEQAKTADPAEVCQAFDIIFGLLDRIDECREDIIFFADEAGSGLGSDGGALTGRDIADGDAQTMHLADHRATADAAQLTRHLTGAHSFKPQFPKCSGALFVPIHGVVFLPSRRSSPSDAFLGTFMVLDEICVDLL